MQLSRRGLLGGLVALVAAPAIIRVESLMALPTKKQIIIPEFFPSVDVAFTRLDVLYGKMHIRPEWAVQLPEVLTLDDYSKRILGPMIEEFAAHQKLFEDAVMYGNARQSGLTGLIGATNPFE